MEGNKRSIFKNLYFVKLLSNIVKSFKNFTITKLLKNIVNVDYTFGNILELFVYFGLFGVFLGLLGGAEPSNTIHFILTTLPGLILFYLGFVGVFIIVLSWIFQRNSKVLLLGGSGSIIGAIALFIYGNNLNNDFEKRFDSYWNTMNAYPGNEYIDYAKALLIVGAILLGIYFLIKYLSKKNIQFNISFNNKNKE